MAGMPAAIAASGGTKKPFSYCPGGIDFSELKSPKMARRIAKHQSGMGETTLTPSCAVPSSPIMAMPQRQATSQTKTLPNYSNGSSQSRPQFGRQRSISDLLSTPGDSPAPSALPQVSSSPIFSYNPYASDRSISIPPPTPPPIIPQQTVDPVNRAISLPPVAAPMAPVRNITLPHGNKVSPGRPGLPPPHPVHQLLQSHTQNEEPVKSSTLPPTPPNSNPRQEILSTSQAQSYELPLSQPSMITKEVPAPPPPPPPPPPPSNLGVVAKFGLAGVPLPGNKQVRTRISLAEIRAGNSYLEPDPVGEVVPVVASPLEPIYNTIDTTCMYLQQEPELVYSTPIDQANEQLQYPNVQQLSDPIANTHTRTLSDNIHQLSQQDKTRENGFVESLHEFEVQRNAMMSPPATQRNINNFQDSRIDSSISPLNLQESAYNQGNQTYSTLPTSFDSGSQNTYVMPQLPVSVSELNSQTLPRNGPNFLQEQSNLNEQFALNDEIDLNQQQPKAENIYQPKLNDDIKMSRPRERSIPRQQSLQRDCEGHNVTPNAYKQETPDFKPKYTLPEQKSIDKDEPELMEINNHLCRRESDANNHGLVRYRPETPRVVTPVKFMATSKLPNKGLSRQASTQDKPQNIPKPPKASERTKPIQNFDDMKEMSQAPTRNFSDSGISVNSSTPEPDDTAGQIVTESMQKIEAQMKKILSSENQQTSTDVAEKIENSESTSSINSFNQVADDSKGGSINNDCPDALPSTYSTMSGYSTCSEEELKFEEPKISIPLKTAPFEVMEDFEEAPEEFDLGISSYSISHPVENEEMEKTPVPEVFENNEAQKEVYEDTPYRVSPPSKSGTLEFEKKPRNESLHPQQHYPKQQSPKKQYPKQKYPEQQDPQQQYIQQQNPQPQYNQQQYQQPTTPTTPMNTPLLGNMAPQNNMFPQMNLPNMGLPINMPNMMGMNPIHPMFDEPFSQFPNMFDQPFQTPGMFNTFQNMPVTTPFQQKPSQDERRLGERIIPIKVVQTNSENLINPTNYTNQTRQTSNGDHSTKTNNRTIEVPIKIESYGQSKFEATPSNKYSPPRHEATPTYKYSPPNFEVTLTNKSSQPMHEETPTKKYSPPKHEAPPTNKYSPPKYEATPPLSKYSPPKFPSPKSQSIPTPPTPPPISQPLRNHGAISPTIQQRREENLYSTLPAKNSTDSPQTVRYGTTSTSVSRNGQMSPTASMLQSQLSQMQNRKEERKSLPMRNESVEDQRPAFSRSNSVQAQDNIRGRLVQKAKTPTFNELQHRYGKHSPSPVLDKDYQKEARQTVVGELSRFGGVQQASKIAGQRRKPSQSPSMRLLGMLHVNDDQDEPVSEFHASSKEYTGDQGRFMPPRLGQPFPGSSGNYQRSLSSQL